MAKNSARLKANEIQSSFGVIKGLDLSIGKIVTEEEAEWEPMGPTPYPAVETLRSWDHKLLVDTDHSTLRSVICVAYLRWASVT